IIHSDCFLEFMEKNSLWSAVRGNLSDRQLLQLFMKAQFSEEATRLHTQILSRHERPIAVRSSSQDEDAERASFAGLYSTVFLPNCHPDFNVRLAQFQAALKIVYASTFFQSARAYRQRHNILSGAEQMGVVVMNVAGRHWEAGEGAYLYHPEISFVLFTFNDYAIGEIKPQDGFARIAFGMGKGVVESEEKTAVRVNLGKPLPIVGMDDSEPEKIVKKAPTHFFALELKNSTAIPEDEESYLVKKRILDHPEKKMVWKYISTYDFYEGVLHHAFSSKGTHVALFQNLLEGNEFLFIPALRRLAGIMKAKYGMDVDLEGAADIFDYDGESRIIIYCLQSRPQVKSARHQLDVLPLVDEQKRLLSGKGAAGMCKRDIWNVVFVPPEKFSFRVSYDIGNEVAKINRELAGLGERGKYLLALPGRVGTREPADGVSLEFCAIDHASAIVELVGEEWVPSYGTHFFDNLISSNISYLYSREKLDEKISMLARVASEVRQGSYATLLRLGQPLELLIDKLGNAVVKIP
ncbi:MAG: PEP/pyruvate-binding domain-containing protein, partial [Candidatus Micrarchaeota archaeon]|nr:PEP/pyruvate-binding domain-containing protein [Candidatus Micrarchaeota archaeon]